MFLQLVDRASCQGLRHMQVIQEPITFITGLGGDKTAPRAKSAKEEQSCFRSEISHSVHLVTEVER